MQTYIVILLVARKVKNFIEDNLDIKNYFSNLKHEQYIALRHSCNRYLGKQRQKKQREEKHEIAMEYFNINW